MNRYQTEKIEVIFIKMEAVLGRVCQLLQNIRLLDVGQPARRQFTRVGLSCRKIPTRHLRAGGLCTTTAPHDNPDIMQAVARI